MATQDIFSPPENLKEYSLNLQKDLETIALLEKTCYLNGHPSVPKCGNLDLAWEFSQDPDCVGVKRKQFWEDSFGNPGIDGNLGFTAHILLTSHVRQFQAEGIDKLTSATSFFT